MAGDSKITEAQSSRFLAVAGRPINELRQTIRRQLKTNVLYSREHSYPTQSGQSSLTYATTVRGKYTDPVKKH
jgi:hypothetical protein